MILDVFLYVTQSRGMSHMSATFNFDFSLLITCPFKMLHFDSNPISKSIFPTSDSFPLIMSHIVLGYVDSDRQHHHFTEHSLGISKLIEV